MEKSEKSEGSLRLLQGGGRGVEGRAWVLVATAARAERLARLHLVRQGIGVYLPMRATKSKRADVAASIPFLPGYLLAQVELVAPRWSDIRSTPGVSGLVQVAGAVARVPDAEVARIRSREVMGLVRLDDPRPKARASGLAAGDRVRIKGGAWGGLEALFDRDLPDQARVEVLIAGMGRLTPLELDMADVEKVG